MLQKNQIIPLTIESITNEGNGTGHYEGLAVFVPMTAPGDVLSVRIVQVRSSYCYGIIEKIINPSPLRIEPDCPVCRRCGGCVLRHLDYTEELRQKTFWTADTFRRIGGFSLNPESCLPSPRQNSYRNKAQYPIGKADGHAFCGFYAARSHTVIPCNDCRLQPPFFSEIARVICAYIDSCGCDVYDEATGRGLFRHIYLRRGESTGQVMVCLVVNGESIPHKSRLISALLTVCPQISSILLNINRKRTNVILGSENRVLYGSEYIEDILCGVRVFLSPLSFYQVNHDGAELLYQTAADFANPQPGDVLLDLYCGAGTIGLSMARRVRSLIGVEIVAPAVQNAIDNAVRNGISNARFLCSDAGQAAEKLAAEKLRPDIIILDPPRKGCDTATLSAAVKMAPSRIVMVSCNPATAARDVKILAQMGYSPEKIQPVDMFPRTAHVETVVLLSKGESNSKNSC